MTAKQLNLKTAPGHEVLAAAGKKILRPGGQGATETLFTWVDFQPGDTVLELASSFGYSAIALAQRYGVKVVGVEKNSESVARAHANVEAAGLSDRVDIREGDIFQLERISEQFDYVLGEAILSMQSASGKAKILQGVGDRLKPGGQFLSHEMLAQGTRIEALYQELATTIRVNTAPLSEAGWQAASEAANLTVQQHQTGPMALLNPLRIAQEEGLGTLLSLGWNLLVHPMMRQRILAMRRVFTEYGDDLGYIIFRAEKLNIAAVD
ncbi:MULTISPECIES: class I SAM-dependent methyltransferase [Cyanophyceae]|uniref:SAM-dependent methyltransferase n=1 Tax=Cyanophyceae TaxID=3028117 RepID=UPI0016894A68|nr:MULTISPECIES: class I SAM-dependent methyltransferase [Cyanophyceae]MBD1914412.1 class I SAM-dependent methyltransferase [Phormidium sp. FACHB-77]MBD2028855.1 class I SAM-dependent methyltransferase [Phormidium sp. FACHB-322]MBD2049241.1 class I SAM-dependent methyltransferase [Leptolyngbya sp. FACHB-60]